MKQIKLTAGAIVFVIVAAIFSACAPQSDVQYDKDLLTGKWRSNTLFEVYNADGTGYTWDEADDVKEEEAQKFEWTLEYGNQLTHIHIMEMTGEATLPKKYTVTDLTANTLSYEDEYGVVHSFIKVIK